MSWFGFFICFVSFFGVFVCSIGVGWLVSLGVYWCFGGVFCCVWVGFFVVVCFGFLFGLLVFGGF